MEAEGVFLNCLLPYLLRSGLSLNLGIINLVRCFASEAQGSPCLWLPRAELTDTHPKVQLLYTSPGT